MFLYFFKGPPNQKAHFSCNFIYLHASNDYFPVVPLKLQIYTMRPLTLDIVKMQVGMWAVSYEIGIAWFKPLLENSILQAVFFSSPLVLV
jgi:hypothetical protein